MINNHLLRRSTIWLLGAALGISSMASNATASIHLVKDLNQVVAAGAAVNGDSNPSDFVEFNGKLYFSADDGVSGRELWKTDGTAAGTKMVVDIVPGLQGSNPNHPFVANGSLFFFIVLRGESQLMRLSADESSLSVMADGVAPSSCPDPVFLNGKPFFTANVKASSQSIYYDSTTLWTTDGTPDGTLRVDLFASDGANDCTLMLNNGALLYFLAGSIWTSDGTRAGTRKVIDASVTNIPGGPRFAHILDGVIYVSTSTTYDNTTTGYIYRSDMTAAGTWYFLFDTPSNPSTLDTTIYGLQGVSNGHVFVTETSVRGSPSAVMTSMLGVTDGSIGTDRTFASLAEYGPPVFLTSSKTYFSGYSPLDTGYEPWVTDGTAAGTHILRDLTPGTGSSEIKWFADYHGTTLFSLSTQANGPQLWKTDGTADGTTLISNINPEPAADPSVIGNFPAHGTAGGDFYFVGHDPVVGTELYVYTHDAPKVTDDSGSSADGKAVTLSVLANDTNGDGTIDTSSVKIAAAPAHGTATAGADGTVTYTPAAGYSGSDTFNYTVADTVGKRSAAATVTLTVTATATTPPANNGGGGGGGALRIVDLAALFAALVVFRISARSTVSPGRARR